MQHTIIEIEMQLLQLYLKIVVRNKRFFLNNTSFSDTLMIFSDNIKIRDGSKKYVPFNNNAKFWTTCSENDIKLSRGK